MVKVIDLCTDCVQVITNPICPNCFSRQVLSWLRDKNLPENKMKKIRQFLKILVREAGETPSDTKCIICGNKKVNLCLYCFTNKAARIVERNTNEEVIESFNEDFDSIIWRIQ